MIITEGIVLKERTVGEQDKFIDILTKESGVIELSVKGARKINGKSGSSTQLFAYSRFCYDKKGERLYLNSAEPIHIFYGLRSSLTGISLASYFAEVLRYITRENNDEAALLLLAFQSLRALESGRIPARLIRAVFEIRTLRIEGEFLMPQEADGFSPAAMQAVTHIAEASLKNLYTFAVSDSVLAELEHIAEVSMERSLHHRFESLEILRTLMM